MSTPVEALQQVFAQRGADPQFTRRDSATDPNQLPAGQVGALNEAAAAVPNQGAASAPVPQAPVSGVSAGAGAPPPPFRPSNDIESFLSAPATNPRPWFDGLGASMAPPAPQDVVDVLPFLQQAASQPDASPRLRALFSVLANRALRNS